MVFSCLNEHSCSLILLVDWDVCGKILGDGIYLSGGMAKVLVPVFPKLPELRLVVFCISDEKSQLNGMLLTIYRIWCIGISSRYAVFRRITCRKGLVLTSYNQCRHVASVYVDLGLRQAFLHILRELINNWQISSLCLVILEITYWRVPRFRWTSSSTLT
jgi:hypothetical protein